MNELMTTLTLGEVQSESLTKNFKDTLTKGWAGIVMPSLIVGGITWAITGKSTKALKAVGITAGIEIVAAYILAGIQARQEQQPV